MIERGIQIKALSSEVRMEILELLKQPKENFANQYSADPCEVGVCMHLIAEKLNLSPPTITRHIDLLRQAGF
ncbi:MAG: winged helix-turn-helix domain-containing protein, partial [Alphaproteobacteria bacterium]